jgi:hypothetical protein
MKRRGCVSGRYVVNVAGEYTYIRWHILVWHPHIYPRLWPLRGDTSLLGAFVKLRKATISFVTSVCPSVCPHGTARLQLHRFSRDLIFEDFSKIFRENLKSYYSLTRITGTLHEDLRTFMTISLWILLRMRNVSDKICGENQNTQFMFNNCCPKVLPLMRRCGKNMVQPERPKVTVKYGACALRAG